MCMVRLRAPMKGIPDMTMFAMKPKFDLAAFLAEKGPKPSSKARYVKAGQSAGRAKQTTDEAPDDEVAED